jgi:hypothetical protein
MMIIDPKSVAQRSDIYPLISPVQHGTTWPYHRCVLLLLQGMTG